MRKTPQPLTLDRSVEIKTAAALATVDMALAELRAVLLDMRNLDDYEGRPDRDRHADA